MHAGPAVVPERPSDWCSVGRVGQEVFPADDRVLHLRSYPPHEDQPMVSPRT